MTDTNIQQQLIDLAHEEALLFNAYLSAARRFGEQTANLLRQLWPAGMVVLFYGREGVVTDWPLDRFFVEVFFAQRPSPDFPLEGTVMRCATRALTKRSDLPLRTYPTYADFDCGGFMYALQRHLQRLRAQADVLKCEQCAVTATHAEIIAGEARAWCDQHTPWSGHFEFCGDQCRALILITGGALAALRKDR